MQKQRMNFKNDSGKQSTIFIKQTQPIWFSFVNIN